jgi:hypothetical protein
MGVSSRNVIAKSESDEAIQAYLVALDRFASLAMTIVATTPGRRRR